MQTPSGSARKGKGKAKSKGRSTGKASSSKKGKPNSAAATASASSRAASSSAQASRRPPPTSSKKGLAARLQQQVASFDETHARLADALESFLRVAGDGKSYGMETTFTAMHDLPAKFSAQLGGVDRLDAKAEKRRAFKLTKGGSETQDQPLVRASVMEAENLLFEIKGVLLAELERTVNSMAQISVDSQEAEGKPPAQSWSDQREIVERYCSEYELAESVCAPLNRETNTDVLRTHVLALRSRPFLEA